MGPARPAVWGVLGYTLFYIVVFLYSCVIFCFYYCFILLFLFVLRVPLLTLGPAGGFFYAWVTHDVTCDSVPFLGFHLLAMSGLVYYLTRSLDICL